MRYTGYMATRNRLHLTSLQRSHLEKLVRSGTAKARTLTKARILLLTDYSTDAHHTNKEIVRTLLVSEPTIIRVRRRCVDGGLEFALYDKPRPGKPPKITGEIEAQITLLACSAPPEGHTRWTLRLLADTVVELGLLDSITHVAISKRLKKTH